MSTPFFSANDLDRLVKLALRTGSAAIYYIDGAMYYYDEDNCLIAYRSGKGRTKFSYIVT